LSSGCRAKSDRGTAPSGRDDRGSPGVGELAEAAPGPFLVEGEDVSLIPFQDPFKGEGGQDSPDLVDRLARGFRDLPDDVPPRLPRPGLDQPQQHNDPALFSSHR